MKIIRSTFISGLCTIISIVLTTTAFAEKQTTEQTFETAFSEYQGRRGYETFRFQFLDALKKFRAQGRNDKALAVAWDVGGRWAYGTTQGERNKGDAKISAMQSCKKFRKKFAIEAPCKVYMVNKKVTLEQY